MRAARRVAVACLLGATGLCAVIAPAPARAQDKAELDKARNAFRQAIAAETAGNWAGALKLLREVSNVKTTPQVRYNIALCEENLGQLVAALGDYELALVDARAANAADVASVVPARIDALRARVPKVVVHKTASARLATISIDGVQLGAAMLDKPMPVDPGSHLVEASAKGYRPFSRSFDIAEKATKTIPIALEAEPSTASSATPTGSASSDNAVEPAARTNVLPFVVGGVGVASLAASGVFYLLRAGTMSDLDKVCGAARDDCPADSQSTFNRGKTYTTIANVTLALGVAGVGAGAVLYFTNKPSESTPRPSVGFAPAAPQAQLGASVVGRF